MEKIALNSVKIIEVKKSYKLMTAPETIPPTEIPPQIALLQMITGYWQTQCVYVAAKLGIADCLKDGAKHYQELAKELGTQDKTLFRLLRALASLGVFAETEPGFFTLTPIACYLQTDVPGSFRAIAVMNGEEHYQVWGELLHSIKTGEPAFEHRYGMNIFQYLDQNPEAAKIFDDGMTSYSSTEEPALLSSYDFSASQTLIDIGGGNGTFLTSILQANPHLQGILFDLPHVIKNAELMIKSSRVSDRCTLVEGDFFNSLPDGIDVYIFKHIIHDWDDDLAIAMLKQCRQVIPPTGKLLIVEQVISPGNDPSIGKLLDLNMLVVAPGGCERTEAEHRKLLEKSSFRLNRIVPTQSPTSIIEAFPI